MKARMKDFNEWIKCSACVCLQHEVGHYSCQGWLQLPHTLPNFLSLFNNSVALPAARGAELNYSWMQHRKNVKPFSHSGFSFMISGPTQPFQAWHSGTLISGWHSFFHSLFTATVRFWPTFQAWPQPLKDFNKTAALPSYTFQMVLMDLLQNIVTSLSFKGASQMK